MGLCIKFVKAFPFPIPVSEPSSSESKIANEFGFGISPSDSDFGSPVVPGGGVSNIVMFFISYASVSGTDVG